MFELVHIKYFKNIIIFPLHLNIMSFSNVMSYMYILQWSKFSDSAFVGIKIETFLITFEVFIDTLECMF